MSLDNELECNSDSVIGHFIFFGGQGTARHHYFGNTNGGIMDSNTFRFGSFGFEKRIFRRHHVFGITVQGPPPTILYQQGAVFLTALNLVMPVGIFVHIDTGLVNVKATVDVLTFRGDIDYGATTINGITLIDTSLLMDVLDR